MDEDKNKPISPIDQSTALAEQDSPALAYFLDDSRAETHCLRCDSRNGRRNGRPLEIRYTVNFVNFTSDEILLRRFGAPCRCGAPARTL